VDYIQQNTARQNQVYQRLSPLGSVVISLLVSSAEDCGFDPLAGSKPKSIKLVFIGSPL